MQYLPMERALVVINDKAIFQKEYLHPQFEPNFQLMKK